MEEEIKLCKDCINFALDNNKCYCDYDLFEDISIYKAIIFVPELFECDKWESDAKYR